MGCAGSKQKRCRHCQAPYSPVPRSYSMHIHYPPQGRDDSYHVVALTSSTLGSLKHESLFQNGNHFDKDVVIASGCDQKVSLDRNNSIIEKSAMVVNGFDHSRCNGNGKGEIEKGAGNRDFSRELIEAKTWSSMMEEKIPKVAPRTPIRTPPGEPETINTWELMEGLEDVSPFRSPIHVKSFSFDLVRSPDHIQALFDRPKSRFQESNGRVSPKPMWLQTPDEDMSFKPAVSDFDPEVISTFRKSLAELRSDHPFYIGPLKDRPQESSIDDRPQESSFDDNRPSINEDKNLNCSSMNHKCQPCGKEKLIVYFTSLRGVRKTYEDCCHVRVILKGTGVRVDERDVSMHSGFKDELKELLGEGFCRGGLPRVFIGRNYIGGAEEIRRMNEEGQLEKLLENCERVDDNGTGGGGNGTCEGCGDIRFVPCETCSGSCKIYYDGDCEEEEEEQGGGSEEGEYGFQRCPDCNENGLIRCPICCY